MVTNLAWALFAGQLVAALWHPFAVGTRRTGKDAVWSIGWSLTTCGVLVLLIRGYK